MMLSSTYYDQLTQVIFAQAITIEDMLNVTIEDMLNVTIEDTLNINNNDQ